MQHLPDLVHAGIADREDAVAMLKQLSGTVHHVYTAVAVKFHDSMQEALSVTEVRLRELSDDEIRSRVRRPVALEDCDLRLEHKSVSKLHCVIVKTDWVTGKYFRHYTRDDSSIRTDFE